MWFNIWVAVSILTFVALRLSTNHPGGVKPQSWLIMALLSVLPAVNGLVLAYIILSHLLPTLFKKVG